MATFISTDKFERWWRKAQAWFATQFASINIDTSDLAKQGTNPNANISDIDSKIGTPATGQPSTLFAAIAAGGGGGITMMTDDEYQPALEDLATKLD